MARDKSIVPALMFHSVGLSSYPWIWSYISEPIITFEAKIALFKRRGINAVFWKELYDHMVGVRELPDNSIFLTFDDGYLDNWIYVFPILKKYGMKGTIFVSPDFVESASAPRPSAERWNDRSGSCPEDAGFLSWPEMRAMEDSGLVDIQSHAMTHTWYFSGPRIVDYHRPHDVTPYPWLFWNANPGRKAHYLTEDQQEFLPWGYPILEHTKSLVARRFFADEEAVEAVSSIAAELGGESFFKRPDWKPTLEGEIRNALGQDELPGVYETDEARRERIVHELALSKQLIEENLDKSVDYICWPGGAYDEEVESIAKSIGYKSWTLSSGSELGKRNRPGVDPTTIKRMGTSNRTIVRGRRCDSSSARYHLWRLLEHQGSSYHSMLVKAYKLQALVRSYWV